MNSTIARLTVRLTNLSRRQGTSAASNQPAGRARGQGPRACELCEPEQCAVLHRALVDRRGRLVPILTSHHGHLLARVIDSRGRVPKKRNGGGELPGLAPLTGARPFAAMRVREREDALQLYSIAYSH